MIVNKQQECEKKVNF